MKKALFTWFYPQGTHPSWSLTSVVSSLQAGKRYRGSTCGYHQSTI